MLKLRLQRIGRRNDPSYRVIVCDSRQGPKSGKFIDLLGSYNPKTDHVKIDGEKAKEWISKGVQVSPTVHNLLIGQKIIEGKKVNVLPKKSPIVAEKTEEEVKEVATDDAGGQTADREEKKEEVTEEATESGSKKVETTEGSEDSAPSSDDEAENTGTEKETESDTTDVDTDESAAKKTEAAV